MSGATLAILSALCFGLNRIFIRRGVLKVPDPTVGVLISVPLSLPFFLLVLLTMGRVHDIFSFSWQSYIWLSAAGVTHFVAGRMFNYTAIQLIGANISAVLGKISPIIAVAVGVSFFSEPLTWQVGIGVLLVILGAVIVTWNPKTSNRGNSTLANVSSKGILYALGTGFFFGISGVFIKLGLSPSASPVAATFVSYFAATIILSAFLFNQKKRTALFSIGNRIVLVFFLAGLLTSLAQLLRYTALSIAPISIVSPLLDIQPIFVIGFSFLFNRKLEIFNRFVIIGVIVTIIGAILLT